MRMKLSLQLLSYSFICLFVYLFITAPVGAACSPIYGGGITCSQNLLSIEKRVLNPKTNLFVHNLGMSDPKYHGNDLVPFQITITNNSNSTIRTVVVKDHLPGQLTYNDGPGSFDPKTGFATFTVNNLAPHHSQTFTMNTHIVSQEKFTQDTFCIDNQVTATPSNGGIVDDSSQLCLEKITSTPSTGANSWAIFSLIPLAFVGLKLKKLS